jgi:hypothetical protein
VIAAVLITAAAPTGNGWDLAAVVMFIFAACLLVSGWRHARRHGPGRER